MIVVGIDVGLHGGLAALGDGCCKVADLPISGSGASARINARAVYDWLCHTQAIHAFIENAGSFPGQGLASSFRYGRAAGSIEAAVACTGLPFTLVAPVTWKKFHNLRKTDKEASRQLAIQRFPQAATMLSRKLDHGRAEALLIASYGLTYLTAQQQRAA